MWQWIFPLILAALPLDARPKSGYYTNPDVDELRIEIDDLKHALHGAQVELDLLNQRVQKQDAALLKKNNLPVKKDDPLTTQVIALEKKVFQLEKTLGKAADDLRTLNASVNQTLSKIQHLELGLSTHDKRLDEVSKLKGTLTSISKAIAQKPESTPEAEKIYFVKAGDSLEKIARVHHISVENIRQLNHLTKDKIIVGQELKLPIPKEP